jgi:hypothetical protein
VALVLLGALLSESPEEDEIEIHARLQEHRLRGEWFVAKAALHEMQRLGARVMSPEVLIRQETTSDSLDSNMNVRVFPEEIEAWRLAAKRLGIGLSQWIRSQLNDACEEDCQTLTVARAPNLVFKIGNAASHTAPQQGVQEGTVLHLEELAYDAHAVLAARIAQLERALAEALDIAEWEASEYRGRREHPARLAQLRQVLAAKVTVAP